MDASPSSGTVMCPGCGNESSRSHRFCSACGHALPTVCGACGAPCTETATFCTRCGKPLVAPVADAPANPDAAASVREEGERRQLTVLFCDVVGSTDLSVRLDPEELREVLTAYQEITGAAIARFGGHVAQYLGDGVVAYFGYPTARGEDAERAVRAGLAIVEALHAAQLPVVGHLAVRVGAHTGTVLVGTLGSGERGAVVALGETPNIAARVQHVAEPDSVVVTHATHRLVSGLFVVADLGRHALKGVAEPVGLYRVVGASGVRSRFHAAQRRGLTPYVGRQSELQLVQSRWQRACGGEGQVVLVVGESGIGKSRLVDRFREELRDQPHLWMESGGQPYHQDTPLYPVAEFVRQLVSWSDDVSAEEQLGHLERNLALAGLAPAEVVPLIAPLLDLPLPDVYPRLDLSPEVQRRKTFGVLAAWVYGVARRQPVVALLEDLHWVDPSTLALHKLLVDQVATERVLLLYTARPEFCAPWPLRSHHAQITLGRLDRSHARQMVAGVAATLLEPDVEAVVARTDGIPLFVEELTQLVLEGGRAADIPTTLRDSLAARLDRLGPAKVVMQVGAVLGREFSYALLHAVCQLPEGELREALERMTDAELVFVRGLPPDSTYVFKHALVQEAAYGSLLRSRLRELHRTIARVLAERFGDVAEAQPEVLARHYTEAGETATAVDAWQRAGERALLRSALVEAAGHLSRGLELLRTLPDSSTRAEREFGLVVVRAHALQSLDGYASSDVLRAFDRARELAQTLGVTPLPLLVGLWEASMGRGDIRVGRELAAQVSTSAEASGERAWKCWALVVQGITGCHSGELASAWESLRGVRALYDEASHRGSRSDPMIMALSYQGLLCPILGLPEEGRAGVREAVERAQRMGRAFDMAWSLFFSGVFHMLAREPEAVLEYARPLRQLASEQRFALFEAFADIFEGHGLAATGAASAGVKRLQEGMARYEATGQRISTAMYLGMLAEAYLQDDNLDEASAVLASALEVVPDEITFEPEILRLRAGTLMRTGGAAGDVERTYAAALERARGIGARGYEVRVATDYARWLHARGCSPQAALALGPTCVGFPSTGAESVEMRTARALLAELQPSGGTRTGAN